MNNNEKTIRFTDEMTEKLIRATLEFDYKLLRDLEEQTPKICSFAIKQNPLAIKYVREQTLALCLEAVLAPGSPVGIENSIRDEAMREEALKWKKENKQLIENEFKELKAAEKAGLNDEQLKALKEKLRAARAEFTRRLSEVK